MTIRLPKRGDEEGGEGEGEGSQEPGGEDGAEGGDETEGGEKEKKEKEPPLGGGKPFRKIQGKVWIIENDEFVTDDDPKGDTKIDKQGRLLGGEYIHRILS